MVGRAIQSVFSQTFKDFEIIVIDDGSEDGTAEWIRETYAYPLVKLIALESNQGVAAARNRGLAIAQGELVAFLDSDDQWLPGFLERHMEALKRNPRAVFSYCDFFLVRDNGEGPTIPIKAPIPSEYKDLIHCQLMRVIISSMSLVTVRRSVLLQEKFNEKFRISEDRHLYLRLCFLGELEYIPEPLVVHLEHMLSLIKDQYAWAKHSLLIVEDFFSDPRSQPYQMHKHKALFAWKFHFVKINLRHPWKFFYFSIKAFLFSPLLFLEAVMETLVLGLRKNTSG